MAGVLYRLGRLCVRRAVVVVAIWLFLAVAVHVVGWRARARELGLLARSTPLGR